MMKRNIGFYERYKKDQKDKEMEESFRKKYNISDDKTVVIEKKSYLDRLLHLCKSFIGGILTIVIYFSIFILSTIGATVLLNQALRDVFFEIIKLVI